MKVSVILPTYNEVDNIIPLVRAIADQIPDEWGQEIIVVDDNSPDGTYDAVKERFTTSDGVKAILRKNEKGLARSIHTGIKNASGDQLIVMDTDFTHAPEEIPRLLHVAKMYDIVSGSRFCAGGRMQDTHHYLCSLLFNWYARALLRTQVQDNTGGFFTISIEKMKALPMDKIFLGYGDYFFRLLHYSQKRHYSIVEIPALYIGRNEGQSKSNFLKMFISYSLAILRIRLEALK